MSTEPFHVAAFGSQHAAFQVNAAFRTETRQRPIRTNNAMAGNERWKGIAPHGTTDAPSGSGTPAERRQLTVGHDPTATDTPQGLIDLRGEGRQIAHVEPSFQGYVFASVEGPHSAVADNLLRLSIGVENCDELINDLEQSLNQL